MSTSPTITLTTDFGHKGPFVGVMKGVIISRCPQAKIIDLTHEIHVHWPAEAGFWLARSYRYFPQGSIHIAVVDPGVGTTRNILVAEHQGHVFLAPDNGLLPLLLSEEPKEPVYRVEMSQIQRYGWPEASATFHGRDIFAPLAADIAAGAIKPADVGAATTDIVPSLLEPALKNGSRVRGTVVSVDHFGNLITNIDADDIVGLKEPEAKAGGQIFQFHHTYGQTTPGDYLALLNSFGVVEIARAEGSAAESLGLGRGAPVTIQGRAK
jgi:S-adenosylmethionine hydrolase